MMVPSGQVLDPDDPYLRAPQTFPQLRSEMVARVATCGDAEGVAEGTLRPTRTPTVLRAAVDDD